MLLALILILVLLILLIGGDKGATSLITLTANCIVLSGIIFLVYAGSPPLPITVAGCIIISAVTLFYPEGISKKSMASFLSVLIVIVLMMASSYIMGGEANIAGFSEEAQLEDEMAGLSADIGTDMLDIAAALIIMSLIGAVLDASVSISSSLYEVHQNHPVMGLAELFHSGIQIGRDIIGTTTNTLFFAYLGESLMLIIRFKIEGYSLARIVNSKVFFQEFIRILFSGASCILAIPATAYILAVFLTHPRFIQRESR